MVVASPVQALGRQSDDVRPLLVDIVRSRHARFAEAHQISGSRYTMGFGSQWRDLLDDVKEALRDRGYRTYKLPPAGYQLPVVNDCLVYVWRVRDSMGTASAFASSPTRVNGFKVPLLDPTLFEPGFTGEPKPPAESDELDSLEQVVRAVGDVMPLVLVIVQSSPRQLQSIEWAVAELDEGSGEVTLYGHEIIWQPETNTDGAVSAIEPFDSGTPVAPAVELQKQENANPDA